MTESRSSSGNGLAGCELVQIFFAVFIVMFAFRLWLLDWSLIVIRAGSVMNRPAAEAAALDPDRDD